MQPPTQPVRLIPIHYSVISNNSNISLPTTARRRVIYKRVSTLNKQNASVYLFKALDSVPEESRVIELEGQDIRASYVLTYRAPGAQHQLWVAVSSSDLEGKGTFAYLS